MREIVCCGGIQARRCPSASEMRLLRAMTVSSLSDCEVSLELITRYGSLRVRPHMTYNSNASSNVTQRQLDRP